MSMTEMPLAHTPSETNASPTPISIPSCPSFVPTEDELSRILPSSLHGPVAFRGWVPVSQPILIIHHLSSNRVHYIGLDGREYRFRPYAEFGGHVVPLGGSHGKFHRK